MFPAEVKQDDALPSYFNSQIVKQASFGVIASATYFCFFLVISLFKGAPKASCEVLSGAPELQKAACDVPDGETHVSAMLRSARVTVLSPWGQR